MKYKDVLLCGVIALSFFVGGFITLEDYSLHWDSTYHFTVADYYSGKILEGEPINLEEIPLTEKFNPVQPENHAWGENHYYSPLSDIIGGFTYRFVSQPLGLDYVSGHHLHLVIFATLSIIILYVFSLQAFGRVVAVLSSLTLALYPRFIGDAHMAVKDMPILFFTILTFYLIWRGIVHEKTKSLLLGSFTLGVLISLKFSNITLALILIIWFVLINLGRIKIKEGTLQIPFKKSYITSGILALVGYVITQPSFFINSLGVKKYLFENLRYWFGTKTVKVFYLGQNYLSTEVPRHYPIVSFLAVTPLPFLFFGFIGLIYSVKKSIQKDKTLLLFALWFTLPIAKFLIPGAPTYQLIRLFLESIPAFAVLVALGMVAVYNMISKKIKNKEVLYLGSLVAIVLIFTSVLFSLIAIHPYEGSYFNSFAENLGEAQKNFNTDYNANSVREGIELVNEKVEDNATVVMPIAGKMGAYFIREDINFVRGENNFGEYDYLEEFEDYKMPFYVVYPYQEDIVYHILNGYSRGDETLVYYVETELEPEYVIERDGAVLFKVYRIGA